MSFNICNAIKKNGQKCIFQAKKDSCYCGIHKNNDNKINRSGQDAKSRNGSSRNGYNVSVSNFHSKEITNEQIEERNKKLLIDNFECYYCGSKNRKLVEDHLIPSCCTKHSIYGQNNGLNIVYSCDSCNGKKGGKVNEEFKSWLKTYCKWDDIKINNLFKWIDENKENLQLNEELVKYLNSQHKHINIIHELYQSAAKKKEDIIENLINYVVNNYTDYIINLIIKLFPDKIKEKCNETFKT